MKDLARGSKEIIATKYLPGVLCLIPLEAEAFAKPKPVLPKVITSPLRLLNLAVDLILESAATEATTSLNSGVSHQKKVLVGRLS